MTRPCIVVAIPWVAAYIQSGDPITDLHENMAAEQRPAPYEYLIQLSDDPGVTETLAWRMREIVHYQRFGPCSTSMIITTARGFFINPDNIDHPLGEL